jgi:hypothetical protein
MYTIIITVFLFAIGLTTSLVILHRTTGTPKQIKVQVPAQADKRLRRRM